ncbi:MAG: hypothetical protein ACKO2S_07780 [Burkholderiaceae bacterium]
MLMKLGIFSPASFPRWGADDGFATMLGWVRTVSLGSVWLSDDSLNSLESTECVFSDSTESLSDEPASRLDARADLVGASSADESASVSLSRNAFSR